MRADRLISLILLLQSRGRMTARELASELEVSERTIYRDVEALGTSGVPIYAEHGPGGGLALLDSYRTGLTGLTEEEQKALLLAFSVPEPLNRLGIGRDLKSAFAKVAAALASSRPGGEDDLRQRFHVDWDWWQQSQEPVPHLAAIQQAVMSGRRMRLFYRIYNLNPIQVVAEPYGLVAKGGAWYLVGKVEGSMRAYQAAWLNDVQVLDEPFQRQEDFQLASFWQEWCREHEDQQRSFAVRLRVSPHLMDYMPLYFGHHVIDLLNRAGPPDGEGWVTLTLSFDSLESARGRILQLGGDAEVLEPEGLRASIPDFAAQILKRYS